MDGANTFIHKQRIKKACPLLYCMVISAVGVGFLLLLVLGFKRGRSKMYLSNSNSVQVSKAWNLKGIWPESIRNSKTQSTGTYYICQNSNKPDCPPSQSRTLQQPTSNLNALTVAKVKQTLTKCRNSSQRLQVENGRVQCLFKPRGATVHLV